MAWPGAERAGYQAIMVTVDAPILGKREADEVNGCAEVLAELLQVFTAFAALATDYVALSAAPKNCKEELCLECSAVCVQGPCVHHAWHHELFSVIVHCTLECHAGEHAATRLWRCTHAPQASQHMLHCAPARRRFELPEGLSLPTWSAWRPTRG